MIYKPLREGWDGPEFRTKNMVLAASLLALGYIITQIEAVDERLRVFVFTAEPQDDDLSGHVDDFWKRELKFEPQLMADCLNELRSQMRERTIN